MLTIYMEGIPKTGLVDTGADRSIFPFSQWESQWPIGEEDNVYGIGGSQWAREVARPLRWTFEDRSGKFWPQVLEGLPIILWGRDLLTQLGVRLTTNFGTGPLMTMP